MTSPSMTRQPTRREPHHILWDKWTEDEIGEHQFIGRLFNDRGQIYRGCTAFDAATYTIQRLAVLGGEVFSAH